jgi:pimeloyl-ACP methyl ester carboxylesterase
MRIASVLRSLTVLFLGIHFAKASEMPRQDPEDKIEKPNLATPTLGGAQLWGDELVFRDWRVQRNVVTGHHRLLDGRNIRRAWGTFDACRAKLDAIKRKRNLPAIEGKVVVVLHGLGRTRAAMNPLCRYLEEHGGYTVLNVGYPSTRASVGDHAAALARILADLDDAEEIDFVGHSLGNLVIRHYLADETDETTGRQPDSRIGRIVMLAPPNQGSERAERWAESKLFEVVLGPAGRQLANDWAALEGRLATPACEFGILAGGRGDGRGWSRALEGDDDGIVSVTATRLLGARDFAVVPVLHTFIMSHETAIAYTLRFLEHGYFVADEKRQPIPRNGEDSP